MSTTIFKSKGDNRSPCLTSFFLKILPYYIVNFLYLHAPPFIKEATHLYQVDENAFIRRACCIKFQFNHKPSRNQFSRLLHFVFSYASHESSHAK
jgi:hypothetical protein